MYGARGNIAFNKDHDHYTKDWRDLKEPIKELIWKGKLQKFVKKGKSSRFRDDCKEKPENNSINEDNSYNHPQRAIEEIKTITRGLSTGGAFKSLRKSQQRQVNNVHEIPPLKEKRQMSIDILFSKEDAKGVK